jgi:hypothetical protein
MQWKNSAVNDDSRKGLPVLAIPSKKNKSSLIKKEK